MVCSHTRDLDGLPFTSKFLQEGLGRENTIVSVVGLDFHTVSSAMLFVGNLGFDGVRGTKSRLVEDHNFAGGVVVEDGSATVLC